MSDLPIPAPPVNPTTRAFWEATAEGRFLLQRCDDCDLVIWFPRRHCPSCWREDPATFDASGLGEVYSYTIIHKGSNEWREAAPYVVAYVELAEGPRVLTNITGCDPADVRVGMPVRIVWQDTGAGSALYRFVPA
jgi:uncharacterized OB-fold protein